MQLSDIDLLSSLEATITEKGITRPTVAGLLLFGKSATLGRLFAQRSKIDYLVVPGREWVSDPERRFSAIETREPLLLAVPRIMTTIMNDIPHTFNLKPGDLQSTHTPLLPDRVVREALVNSMMHREYQISSPTQIIRYSNRIEFRNAGYSLKKTEQIGVPGSLTRNETISKVFRDINFAETRGTGIHTMQEELRKLELAVPLIESDRALNIFSLTLLPHHLFNPQNLEWLNKFSILNLSEDERRMLVVLREMGAINLADYSTISNVNMIIASFQLKKLTELGLIEKKGQGHDIYYIPTKKLLMPEIFTYQPSTQNNAESSQVSSLPGGLTPQISSLPGGLTPQTSALPDGLTPQLSISSAEFPQEILKEIQSLGQRASQKNVMDTIKKICAIQALTPAQIASLLNRNPKYVRDTYLIKLVRAGELILTFPDIPAHPLQAYKTKRNIQV